MVKKTYGIYGIVERFLSVRLGGGAITFSFTGGSMDSAAIRPATLTTSNDYEQKIIENHPEFKNGRIKLIKENKVNKPEADVTAVESVANIQDARKYLQERGYELKDLASKADVLNVAKEMNVVFPNWNK